MISLKLRHERGAAGGRTHYDSCFSPQRDAVGAANGSLQDEKGQHVAHPHHTPDCPTIRCAPRAPPVKALAGGAIVLPASAMTMTMALAVALALIAAFCVRVQREARRLRAEAARQGRALDAARALLQVLPDAVIALDPAGRVSYLNPRAETLTGVCRQHALGQPLAALLNLQHDGVGIDLARHIEACLAPGAAAGPMRDAALGQVGARTEVQYGCFALPRAAGAAGTGIGTGTGGEHGADSALLLVRDVSERRSAEARLEFIAHHDGLTGLPNRLQLRIQLDHGIAYARRHGSLLAVLFVDIDGFKAINDSLGHDAGDQVLTQFSQRLLRCVREVDTVARQGGDEFIVLLTELSAPQDAERVAEKIAAAIVAPFVVGDSTLAVAASVGIALYPHDDEDSDALIEKADLAMYAAKQRGPGLCQRFAPGMQAKAYTRMILETALRHALKHEEFILTYLPKLDLKRQVITGVKALIRWQHPELGLVMPLDFIPILEDSALIVPVGAWVLATAVAQARRWIDLGRSLTVSVNLSARQFYQKDIVQSFAAILQQAGVPGHYVELEITESILIDKNQNCEAVLRQFKQLGMGISISDFGTGYASLNYLRRFPVDVVKIDKCFIDDLRRGGQRRANDRATDDGAMVRAIIAMAHTLNMKVIAGGIETDEQLAQLTAMDCDEAFGFCLSRAVAAHEIDALLAGRLRQIELVTPD